MSNALYDPGREGILDDSIAMSTDDIRMMLVLSTYTFSAAHKFLADLGAVDNGRSAALASKTFTSGVFDAADTTLTAIAAAASKALVVFKHTGSDATARVISYTDGIYLVDIAADAAGAATTVIPEDLPDGAANGAVFTKISGTGPATFTLSAGAAVGARTLAVTALGSNIVAGAVYAFTGTSGSGLPMTPSVGQVLNIAHSNGANKIFKL
jgi:hypothetical protein